MSLSPITPVNTYNSSQYFNPSGIDNISWEDKDLPFAASVAIPQGALVQVEISGGVATGNLTLATPSGLNVKGATLVGIMKQPIASTDSDYATAGKLKTISVIRHPMATATFVTKATTTVKQFGTYAIDTGALTVDGGTAGIAVFVTDVNAAGTGGTVSFPFAYTQMAS